MHLKGVTEVFPVESDSNLKNKSIYGDVFEQGLIRDILWNNFIYHFLDPYVLSNILLLHTL